MSRYIDADALAKEIKQDIADEGLTERFVFYRINEAPSIDIINTRALDFVVELIEYIAEYPDDDYMTMECLCRKLYKHGLIDKKDGEWTTNFIERKTDQTERSE